MKTIDTNNIDTPSLHKYLLGAIGPRPIAFASTLDKKGNPNLSPFSFFNVFSANPPILIFSPARSGITGKNKNTLENVKEVPEVVINVVNYNIVQQMSLSSAPYEKGVNEFLKSGLTMLDSEVVKPFRVKESPVHLECKVLEIKELGNKGGAGNLVICEVLKIHINEAVLDKDGFIDQQKIDLVARMGGNWYCRTDANSMFEIPKPIVSIGVGVDTLPDNILNDKHLSGNDLGILGSAERLPSYEESIDYVNIKGIKPDEKYEKVKALLKDNNPIDALKVLTAL
ncbi:MAG: flavin reductase family protein [Vicingaceae bacterium]